MCARVCMRINNIKHSAGNTNPGLFFQDHWWAEPKHTKKVKMYASVFKSAASVNSVQLSNQRIRHLAGQLPTFISSWSSTKRGAAAGDRWSKVKQKKE